MSKEYLEAIEEIGNIDLGDNPYKTFERNKLKNAYNKEFGTINQALQRLESIDSANPSKALSVFRSVELTLKENRFLNEGSWLIDNLNTIKQALLKAQEQEKVLEIIIDREVSIQSFRRKNYKDYEDYCNRSSIYENSTPLTKEEFELLKRWLYNEQIN